MMIFGCQEDGGGGVSQVCIGKADEVWIGSNE